MPLFEAAKYCIRPLFSVFVFLLITSCSPPEDTRTEFTWGGPRNISMLPLIMVRNDLFSDSSYRIKTENIQTGKLAMDAVESGAIEVGVLVDSNIAFLGFEENPNSVVVATIQQKWDDSLLIANPSDGDLQEQLIGNTIAVTFGTTSHIYAARLVESLGLSHDQVEYVNMPPPAIQAGLISGEVSIGSLWQPFRYNVEREAPHVKVVNDAGVYKAFAIVVVNRDFLESHPNAVRSFLAGLKRAEELLVSDQERIVDMLAIEVGISRDALKKAWPEYDVRLELNSDLLPLLQEQSIWIRKTNASYANQDLPDYSRLIDASFLPEK